ncbi:conserved hypothetical protein [Oenococcus oeni]|nr:conserved hypothetical protein [Oenococcus oeni]SYW05198.1 conserved hypothetical protein [Oenococcus oeni]SYW19320.1 conserved hypothetical protein [Oenococcus oeni]
MFSTCDHKNFQIKTLFFVRTILTIKQFPSLMITILIFKDKKMMSVL